METEEIGKKSSSAGIKDSLKRIKAFFQYTPEQKALRKDFIEELNRLAYKLQRPAAIASMVAWLGFAFDTDPKLHPDFHELFYVRIGLTITGAIVLLLTFFPRLRGKGLGLLYMLGGYIYFTTPVFTAYLADDAAYMSGYMLVLLIGILMPLPFKAIVTFLSASVALFLGSFLYFAPEWSGQIEYSIQNLGIAVMLVLIFGYFLDYYRFMNFIDREKLKIVNAELKKFNEQIRSDLETASEIQKGILPDLPPVWNGYTFSAWWEPMEKVSGDFYDLIPMPGDSLGVLVADVMGHGIPAALVTTMAKITFQEQCRRNTRLDEIFYHVNRALCDNVPGPEYLTAFLLRLEKDGTIHYANASHSRAILYRAATRQVEFLDTDGLFIGAIREKNMKYEFQTDKLEYGDKLFLMTDGIIEFKNEQGEEYSESRVIEIILSNADKKPDELKEIVLADFAEFQGGRPNQDDLTFLVLERDPRWDEYVKQRDLVAEFLGWKQTSKALQVLQELKDSGFSDSSLDLYFGKAWYLQENYKEAAKYLSRYHTLRQDNFEAALMLASSYYNLQEYARAQDAAQDALNLNRNSAQAHYLNGMALAKTKNYADAIYYLEQAVALNPNSETYITSLRRIQRLAQA